MQLTLLIWALGAWGGLVLVAILNGVFRNDVLVPHLGEKAGRAISSVTLSCAILCVSYLLVSTIDLEYPSSDLWLIGIIWLSLTLIFEFGFGHYVVGKSWPVLLDDYNICDGKIWTVVRVTTLVGPYLMRSLIN